MVVGKFFPTAPKESMRIKCNVGDQNYSNEPNLDIYSRLVKERVLFLYEEIDTSVATNMAATLLLLDLQNSEKEITLYINSNGGCVPNGLLTIYDTIQHIKSPIKTVCIGEAYSSAALLLASGTPGKRYAYPSSRIMIHNIQVEEMSGTQKEIQEEAKRIKNLNQTLMQIIASHTGQPLRKIKKDCDRDKYFTPEQAIKYGLIDYILDPSKKLPVFAQKPTQNT